MRYYIGAHRLYWFKQTAEIRRNDNSLVCYMVYKPVTPKIHIDAYSDKSKNTILFTTQARDLNNLTSFVDIRDGNGQLILSIKPELAKTIKTWRREATIYDAFGSAIGRIGDVSLHDKNTNKEQIEIIKNGGAFIQIGDTIIAKSKFEFPRFLKMIFKYKKYYILDFAEPPVLTELQMSAIAAYML